MVCGNCDHYKAHNCKHQCMDLPEGMTCGDCIHKARCIAIFGAKESNTSCDFEPIRFKAKSEFDAGRKILKNEKGKSEKSE